MTPLQQLTQQCRLINTEREYLISKRHESKDRIAELQEKTRAEEANAVRIEDQLSQMDERLESLYSLRSRYWSSPDDTLFQKVVNLHMAHPDWTGKEIGKVVGVSYTKVSALIGKWYDREGKNKKISLL